MPRHRLHKRSGRHTRRLAVEGQEHHQVYTKFLQQRQLLAERGQIARRPIRRQDYRRVGVKGDQGCQAVCATGPLHQSADECLMAAMQPIKGTDGEDRLLPWVSLGQVINYLHSLPSRETALSPRLHASPITTRSIFASSAIIQIPSGAATAQTRHHGT